MSTEALDPDLLANLQHQDIEYADPFSHVTELEEIAKGGFDTYKGVRALEFRVGIEMEFQIGNPEKFRKTLSNPDTHDSTKRQLTSEILNPATIGVDSQDNSEVLGEFKDYTRTFIGKLMPKDEAEQATKSKWLGQIDKFSTAELFNFMLYEEFSVPQLGTPSVSEKASLEEVDSFAEQNGWLEWRFGNGSLQSGYYDNVGMSEIRLTPCSPAEALRRSTIIKGRMKELGEQFDVLVRTSAKMEHINISAYDKNDSTTPSIIGNDPARAEDTVDTASGIMKAHQDGINLNPKTIKNYDFMFSQYSSDNLSVGPTRKLVRILDSRIELRGGFSSTANGIAWLAAGAIEGLSRGVDSLREAGYPTANYGRVLEVQRTSDFDKTRDIQIQRAFENSEENADGTFKLDVGYETIRHQEIQSSFFGDNVHSGMDACIVMAAAKLSNGGIPFVTAESIRAAHAAIPDSYKRLIGGDIDELQLDPLVTAINNRLNTICIIENMAVVGRSERVGIDRAATIAKLSGSKVVALALGGDVTSFTSVINSAANEFASKNTR